MGGKERPFQGKEGQVSLTYLRRKNDIEFGYSLKFLKYKAIVKVRIDFALLETKLGLKHYKYFGFNYFYVTFWFLISILKANKRKLLFM